MGKNLTLCSAFGILLASVSWPALAEDGSKPQPKVEQTAAAVPGEDQHELTGVQALENASDLIVLGWPGYTNTSGKLFGSVIDPIVDNPPTDVVVVRYRQRRPLRKILVPIMGEINSRRAVRLAVNMARSGDEGPAQVTVLHILP